MGSAGAFGVVLDRLGGILDSVLKATAGTLLLALLAVVTAGIVSRGVNHPLSWTDEASGYIMVWLACSGWMIATRQDAHIRIRFFFDRLPPKGRTATHVLIHLGTMLLGVVLAWTSVKLIRVNSDIEATALPLATAWIYAPVLPAGIVACLQAAIDVFGSTKSDTGSVQGARG